MLGDDLRSGIGSLRLNPEGKSVVVLVKGLTQRTQSMGVSDRRGRPIAPILPPRRWAGVVGRFRVADGVPKPARVDCVGVVRELVALKQIDEGQLPINQFAAPAADKNERPVVYMWRVVCKNEAAPQVLGRQPVSTRPF